MTIPKKYFHDRLILLLLSVVVFTAFLAAVWVLFKLDSARSASYITQYRSSVGISKLKQGDSGELVAFIGFAILTAVISALLSVRAYPIRREVSVVILGLGALLIGMSIIVSNALLVLR